MGLFSMLFGSTEKVFPTPVRTAAEFQELVINSELPVIVDLWSPTCGPCKRLGPVLTEVATKYEGKLRVVEIDVSSAQPQVLSGLKVAAVPTLLLYRGGENFGRTTGFRPKSWFDEMIAVEIPEAVV